MPKRKVAEKLGAKRKSPNADWRDHPNETLYPNPIPQPELITNVEEEEVTDETKSEWETIAYEQSEEGDVVPEKVPIQGEASWEVPKKKTRSGLVVKRPEWLGQNVMIKPIEQKKPVQEPEKWKTFIVKSETYLHCQKLL